MRQILLPAKLYRSQEPHLVLIIVNLIKESNFTKSFLIFFFQLYFQDGRFITRERILSFQDRLPF